MPYRSFLIGALAAAVLPALGFADGHQGPKPKDSFKLSPDTVYFTKTGTETTLVRTVNLHRVGQPSGSLQFTAVASSDSGGNWLVVSPAAGAIPTDLVLTAIPGTLGPGIYTGKVTVTPGSGGGSAQIVKAVLRILAGPAGAPAAFVRPLSLKFHMVYGGANPEARILNVSSPTGGATFTWTASRTILNPPGGNWLSIAPPSGTGHGLIAATVNGAGLNPGVYNAIILVTTSSTTTQVPVTLEVRPSAPANLVIDPRAFNFIVHPGGPAPGHKILRVKNTGSGTLNWTAVATSSGNWLSIEPLAGTTPGEIKLTVKPEGLTRGHYAGSVAVTAGGRTETARVFLRILGPAVPSPAPILSPWAVQIAPRALEFCLCGGVLTPLSVSVQLSSQLTGLTFTAKTSTAAGGDWLKIDRTAGAIPGAIGVTAAPSGLATGVYSGLISISITGAVSEQRSVPVTLKVSPQATLPWLTTRPGAIAFQGVRGGANPAPQQVSLDAHGAASIPYKATVTVTTPVNWLSVSPDTGSAPRTVTVSVNTAGLAAGVYAGAIVFQSTGAPAAPTTLNVFLQLLAPPSTSPLNARSAAADSGGLLGFFAEPASEFLATAGSSQAVLVALKAADGKPVAGAVVEVTPSTGDPPFMLEDAGGGLYSGIFHSLATGPVALAATATTGAGATVTFGVGGDLDGGPDVPVIFSGGIVNAADFAPAPTPLVPGSLASLFGWSLADASAAASALPLPRELGGVKVLVGGMEAPLISVTPGQAGDQVNFQIPLEAAAWSYADVVVLSNGVFSAPEGIATAPAVPALFTRNFQGTGVLAALHSDFTQITSERPARAGEIVLLYATALGEVAPAQQSGRAPAALSRLVANTRVLIAGREARAGFVGLAPGFVGLYQINVTVPEGTPPGDAAVEIIVDGVGSREGVVILIR